MISTPNGTSRRTVLTGSALAAASASLGLAALDASLGLAALDGRRVTDAP